MVKKFVKIKLKNRYIYYLGIFSLHTFNIHMEEMILLAETV